MAEKNALQFYLKPAEAIEVSELTAALGSLSRQYAEFVESEGASSKDAGARLLVGSVSEGSIDISLVPDMAGALVPLIGQAQTVLKFGEYLKWLITTFKSGKELDDYDISVKDCNDVINVAAPISNNGGTQSINVVQGDYIQNVLKIDSSDAKRLVENAAVHKARLREPESEARQRVAMVWKRLDRVEAKTEGKSSPDKVLISDIDENAKPVFFEDELAYLKDDMLAGDDNPMTKVYFVDVEVSRVEDKVASYRIIAYHHKEDL